MTQNLAVGRVVMFVLENGEVRPADVVIPNGLSGDLTVKLSVQDRVGSLPGHEHNPATQDLTEDAPAPLHYHIQNVPYDPTGQQPGTWHWWTDRA